MIRCEICLSVEGEGFQRYDIGGRVVSLWVCVRALRIGYCRGVVIR